MRCAECLRDEVAPLALIAYPEAYEELRRTVLLLVVDEGDGLFGCTDELWQKQTSTHVAGMFSRTIRQAAGRLNTCIPHTKLQVVRLVSRTSFSPWKASCGIRSLAHTS